jgi:hypothetical protein
MTEPKSDSTGKKVGYWITTGLIALAFLAGGAGDLSRGPEMVEGMAHLGYAPYFLLILGVWKVLAVPALLAPKLPRLKEWAYAGIVFDLTGASLSHAASGDAAGKVITPLVILAIAVASWALRPESRRLAGPLV